MSTTLRIKNTVSFVEDFIPPKLADVLGTTIYGYRKKRVGPGRYITERYSNHVSLYNTHTGSFPTGLFSEVKKHVRHYESDIKVVDDRVAPNRVPFKVHKEIVVREQIAEGIDIALKATRGIFEYCTGSGKTRWATKFIQRTGCNTLYLVPSIGVLDQTYKELAEYIDTSIGVIGDGREDYEFTETQKYIPNILVCTVQSLWSIFKNQPDLFAFFIQHFESIIFDECHHINYKSPKPGEIPYNSWYITAQKFENAYYRIGLTATAYGKGHLGRMMLEGVTGKIQHTYGRVDAERDGVVCPFECRIYDVFCQESRSWQESYKKNIVENDEYHALVAKIARELVDEGRKVVIIFDEVENHVKPVAELLPEAKVLTGDDDGKTRTKVQKELEKGIINIILTTVISEGVNLPAIDAIILAAGKGSDLTVRKNVSQRVGRGSRVTENKENLIVVDFNHVGNNYLSKHSTNRIRIMKELGGTIVFKDSVPTSQQSNSFSLNYESKSATATQ